jgi:hypothetical protein
MFWDDQLVCVASLSQLTLLSHFQVGLLGGTAFSLIFGCTALPMAFLSDFVGDRRFVLCGALVVFSTATALCSIPSFSVVSRGGEQRRCSSFLFFLLPAHHHFCCFRVI